jgi:hypothetical protein
METNQKVPDWLRMATRCISFMFPGVLKAARARVQREWTCTMYIDINRLSVKYPLTSLSYLIARRSSTTKLIRAHHIASN